MGDKTDKRSSGGELDYEDGEANDLLADDVHAKKSLPKEPVDHATTSHGAEDRVSIPRSKNGPRRLGCLGSKQPPATHD